MTRRWQKVLWGRDFPEALSILGKLLWSLWVLAPWTALDVPRGTYRVLLTIAPEWSWGLVILLIALAHLWVFLREWLRARRVFTAVGVAAWSGILMLVLLGGWRGPAIVLYIDLIVTSVIAHLRLRE